MSESWQLGSRYTLERRIGSGVMGQVWAGHDVDGHPLAFKLLRPEVADDPSVVARFLQERNLLVGLRSLHVIRVHDLVVEGPRLAIVMDLVTGGSLRGLLQQRGNLPLAQVAVLGSRIARGLAAVHAAGVLHRDLKPENVLLDDTSGTLEPKLADFGVASLVGEAGQPATANVIGTPQYLAPELGDGHRSTRAGDLYALGITLYEMACGTVPFNAEPPVALLRLHADHAPGRPDGLPDELWNLIASLLAKNPGERPDDANLIAAALEDMAPRLAQMPTPAPLHRPPPTRLLTAPAPAPAPASAHAASGAAPDATGATTPAAGHRRSILMGAALVAALCLVALVAWLLMRDSSGEQPSPKAAATSSAPRSGSASPTEVRASLASTLTGGATRTAAEIDGQRYSGAIVPDLPDRQACTSSVRFALDARYDTARFVAASRTPHEGEAVTITARLDGDTTQTFTLGREPEHLSLELRKARTLTLEIHEPRCGSQTRSNVVLTEGTLTGVSS